MSISDSYNRWKGIKDGLESIDQYIKGYDPTTDDVRTFYHFHNKLSKLETAMTEKEKEMEGPIWQAMQPEILASWKQYILTTANEDEMELAQSLQTATDFQKWHWAEKQRSFRDHCSDPSKRRAEIIMQLTLPETGPMRLFANDFNGYYNGSVELSIGIVLRAVPIRLSDKRAIATTVSSLVTAVAGANAHLDTLKKSSSVFAAAARGQETTFLRWLLILYLAGPDLGQFSQLRLKNLQWENEPERKSGLKMIKKLRVMCECCMCIDTSYNENWLDGLQRFLGKGFSCKQREMYGVLLRIFRLTEGGECEYNPIYDRFSIAPLDLLLDQSWPNRTKGGETEGLEEIMNQRFDWQSKLADLLFAGPIGSPVLGKRQGSDRDLIDEEVELAHAFLSSDRPPPAKRPRTQEVLDSSDEE